jgi:hypothetical protein
MGLSGGAIGIYRPQYRLLSAIRYLDVNPLPTRNTLFSTLISGCFHNRMRAKELKRRLSSQFTKKSKRVENTLELVLSRTVQT